MPDGRVITKYVLQNTNGLCAEVIDFGAVLVSLKVPDDKGDIADVVLGYDTLEEYLENPDFFGATVGPNANRIGGAAFVLDGQRCELDPNDNGNNLHSHKQKGFHKRIWNARCGDNSVTFFMEDGDGSLGFPGNRKISVTYTLNEKNQLILEYHGVSDRNTIFNMTNHSYFNLKGHGVGSIEDHLMHIKASHYTPTSPELIPTGEIAPVAETPMDFTVPHTIGERIDDGFEPLKVAGGYDHNWVLDNWNGSLQQFAEVSAAGRTMKVYTTLPGVQFYAGNMLPATSGKGGMTYGRRGAFCLETQFFPDTANKPGFPSAVFGPGREYKSTTIYEFL